MNSTSLILGIETSCDETSCAVVADGRTVLSNVVASQIDLHARFGGVVPEIASRAHIEAVNTVIAQALAASGVRPEDLSAVAVTNEPGLIGSLLVGLMAAKTLAWVWDRPLIGINHVYAHAYAAALEAPPIEYPAAALICSGGHTALYRCGSPTDLELLGTTIDDAAGEAFDKVACILKLGYPGGPVIDKVARDGDPAAVDFPRTLLRGASLDFSFSGIKTAVLYHVNGVPRANIEHRTSNREPATTGNGQRATGNRQRATGNGQRATGNGQQATGNRQRATGNGQRATGNGQQAPATGHLPLATDRGARSADLSAKATADIAASFQAAVVDVLRIKLRRAARKIGAKTLIIGGGVAANTALRKAVADLAERLHCACRMPEMRFCVDNAAMIAGLAQHYLKAGKIDDLDLDAHAAVRR